MHAERRFAASILILLAAGALTAPAIEPLDRIDPVKWNKEKLLKEADDPAVFPQFTNEIAIARTFPRTFGGTVSLDGKPAPGIRVTDGMSFVKTGEDGRYQITVEPDAMQPYLPNRNLSVCWPDNTFPARDAKGDLQWWRCIGDYRDRTNQVDFQLVTRQYKKPLVIAFASDPHNAISGPHDRIWGQEMAANSGRVDIAIYGGDLLYADFNTADEAFGSMRQFTREFPVPLIHVQGNHDFTSPLFGPHPRAGYGPFTRFLGPIRWSFDAGGVHIASMNYWLANSNSVQWLERDIEAAGGKPVYLLVHSWGDHTAEICEKFPNVRLVQGGHSHTTLPSGSAGEAEFWCYFLYYRLIYIEDGYFDFVERDVIVNPLYRYSRRDWKPDGQHAGVSNRVVKSEAVELEHYPKSNHYDLSFSVAARKAKAKRWGLRIVNRDRRIVEFSYAAPSNTLHLAGRETYLSLDPVPGYAACNPPLKPQVAGPDAVLTFRISVQPDRLHVTVNDVISHITFLPVGPAERIELFAEDGKAEFLTADVWEKGSPVETWNDYTRPPRSFDALTPPSGTRRGK